MSDESLTTNRCQAFLAFCDDLVINSRKRIQAIQWSVLLLVSNGCLTLKISFLVFPVITMINASFAVDCSVLLFSSSVGVCGLYEKFSAVSPSRSLPAMPSCYLNDLLWWWIHIWSCRCVWVPSSWRHCCTLFWKVWKARREIGLPLVLSGSIQGGGGEQPGASFWSALWIVHSGLLGEGLFGQKSEPAESC